MITSLNSNLSPVNTSMSRSGDAPINRLLAALPAVDRDRLQSQLEDVELPLGRVLCKPGVTSAHLYFPSTAIVSLMHVTQDGSSTELALVGNDGVVGISVFMGGNFTPGEAVVNCAGHGQRLSAQAVAKEFALPGPVRNTLLRYTQALIMDMAQNGACNRHHSIHQQLCRRLLHGLDRSLSSELRMTQELLASLLGVRREGVTSAALKLQQAGAISYRRGRIDVLDRAQLELGACECYGVTRRERARLLPALAEA